MNRIGFPQVQENRIDTDFLEVTPRYLDERVGGPLPFSNVLRKHGVDWGVSEEV